jgi:hypothetical protein
VCSSDLGFMTILKAIASTLLSLLLFVGLTVMGVAITVNAAALNSGFITRQIDKLDVVALFNEEALPELEKDVNLAGHPEVISGIRDAVANNAPAVKTAVNKAVTDIYAYLTHGGTLDLRQTLKGSILDPQLAVSIVNSLDLSLYIHDQLVESLPPETIVIAGFDVDLTPYVDDVVPVIEPYFKEQVALALPRIYDYILGDSPALELSVPVGPVLNDVRSALKSAILDSPPPSLAGMPGIALSLGFDVAWEQALPEIPVAFDIVQPEGGFENSDEINQAFQDAERGLSEARKYVAYYQAGFWGLVSLTLMLIGGIILINRNVKVNCRILGGVFATYGITEAAGVIISRGLIHNQMASSLTEVPSSIRPWLVQLVDSLMNPLLVFSIFCAALGVTLFVVSFLYHHKQEPSPSP